MAEPEEKTPLHILIRDAADQHEAYRSAMRQAKTWTEGFEILEAHIAMMNGEAKKE